MSFLMQPEFFFSLLFFVFGVFIFIFNFFKTRNLETSLNKFFNVVEKNPYLPQNNFKEEDTMKYRLPDYQEKDPVPAQDMSESNIKHVLIYDENTKELIDTGEIIDLQEQINSFKECAIDEILKRLELTRKVPVVEEVNDLTLKNAQDDLADLADIIDSANSYREAYGLPADLAIEKVFDFVSNQATILKHQLSMQKPIKDPIDKPLEKKDSEV